MELEIEYINQMSDSKSNIYLIDDMRVKLIVESVLRSQGGHSEKIYVWQDFVEHESLVFQLFEYNKDENRATIGIIKMELKADENDEVGNEEVCIMLEAGGMDFPSISYISY